jgi:hypothetical protein
MMHSIPAPCVHDGAVVEPSEENDDEEEPEGPRVNNPNEEKSQQEAFGVRSKDGSDNVKDHGDEGDEEIAQEGQKENENAGKGDERKDPSVGSVGNQGSGGEREEGFGANGNFFSQPDTPNPFKNPGDATSFWHKKLKMVESGQDNPDEEPVARDDDSDDDAAKKVKANSSTQTKTEASTSQVLGEATEENMTPFDDLRHDHEDERPEEDTTVKEQPTQQQDESSSRKTCHTTPLTWWRNQKSSTGEDELQEDEPYSSMLSRTLATPKKTTMTSA